MSEQDAAKKLGPEEIAFFRSNRAALALAAVTAWEAGDYERLEILSALKPTREELIRALGGL